MKNFKMGFQVFEIMNNTLSGLWRKIREPTSFKQSDRYTDKNMISLTLFTVFIIAILSHVLFSVGLLYDGSVILEQMIFYNSFSFYETSRQVFHFLYQIPAWLFIRFAPSDSLYLLAQVFSFGLIWIHIFSIMGCWLILPKEKKSYIFFPLFAFLVGPLTALDHSISASLSVFSYVWFTAFVIYYSDLSSKLHKALFFLVPLPLLFSHELMSYASLLLIFLCALKIKHEATVMNKALITGLVLFFTVTFFVSVYFIILPTDPLNRNSFLLWLLQWRFLYDQGFFLYAVLALNLTIIPFFQVFRPSPLKTAFLLLAIFVCLTVNITLLIPSLSHFLPGSSPYSLYPSMFNRVWVFLILPFTLFLWFLFEKERLHFNSQKVFLGLCLLTSISLTQWRVKMDYNLYQFQKQFSENLKPHTGILESQIIEEFAFSPKELMFFYHPYFSSSASLIFPRLREVKAVTVNPFIYCLIACEKNQTWDTLQFDSVFDSKEERQLYCQKRCQNHEKQIFHETISTINTRFFDFTSLKKHLKKHQGKNKTNSQTH